MSPSRKRIAQTNPSQSPRTHAYVRHITALEAAGWHLVRLRPSTTGPQATLWYATSERYDEGASVSVTEADPDAALAELVRYARADGADAPLTDDD